MSLPPSVARILINFSVEQEIFEKGGSCLTFGRQFVHLGELELYRMLAEFRIAAVREGQVTLPERIGRNLLELKATDQVSADAGGMEITDQLFFRSMGFDELKSLDVSTFEDADFAFDLNDTGIRPVVGGEFDWVLDAGTMEHVFHVPNVLKNMFDALKVGGCAIHISPSNNLGDHGFFQFSPMFFYQYYRQNNFDLLHCLFCRQVTSTSEIGFSDYTPGDLDGFTFAASDAFTYSCIVCARKTESSTWDVKPQQLSYEETWVEAHRKKG